MTSSSALCVFAGARLISSASSRCVNTGPRTTRISIVFASSTAWPVMSEGIMSGVNWTRPVPSCSACDSARTSSVLPSPGTPSMSTCPEATSASTTSSITRGCPTTASATLACSLPNKSAAFWRVPDSVSMFRPSVLQEYSSARGLEDGNRIAQFVSAARAGEMQRGAQLVGRNVAELGMRGDSLLARQAVVRRLSLERGVAQRAHGRRVQRLPAAEAHREMAGAADLLRQRTARGRRRRDQRAVARGRAPQAERYYEGEQQHRGRAELPRQLDDGGMVLLREESHVVSGAQLRRRHDQSRVISEQEVAVSEWICIEDRHAAFADTYPRRV